MSSEVIVRPLVPRDRPAWEPLWLGYQEFYKVSLGAEVTENTWARFHDPTAPYYALGAWLGGELVGITHYVFQPTCWSVLPRCYLQDLYTLPECRGKGVGRALIEAVAAEAKERGGDKITWHTSENNETARRLYDRLAEKTEYILYSMDL
ncbi:MAG: GNAT family N-acetyltransferase [Armatimonadetes bacterium]|nr:GNAT family N-acetyltransferase [Armatimonadota bacterium]